MRLVLNFIGILCLILSSYFGLLNISDELYQNFVLLVSALSALLFILSKFRLSVLNCSLLIFTSALHWFWTYGDVPPTLWLLGVYASLDSNVLSYNPLSSEFSAEKFLNNLFLLSVLLFSSQFLISLIIHDPNALNYPRGVNGLSSVYLAVCSHSFISKRYLSIASVSFFALGFILLSLTAIFSQVYLHEYLYFFSGNIQFILHPEFFATLLIFVFLLTLLIITTESENFLCLFFKLISLSFSLIIFVTILKELQFFSKLSALPDQSLPNIPSLKDIAVGAVSSWREVAHQSAPAYRTMQFPFSGLKIFVLDWGIVWVVYLVYGTISLINLARKNHKVNFVPVFLVALLLGISLYLPGLDTTVGFCSFGALLALVVQKHNIEIDSIYYGNLDKNVLTFTYSVLGSAGLLVILQGFLAFVQMNGNRRDIIADTSFTVPAHIIESVVASEDVLFFEHHGLDFARLKWTIRDTLQSGEISKGASTISMQLAKIRYLNFEKTFIRKIQQCWLAIYIEMSMSKEEILKEYLAVLGYAPGVHGLNAVSREIFHKSPNDLSIEEGRKIALSIPDPLTYNPGMKPTAREEALLSSLSKRVRSFHDAVETHVTQLSFVH